MAGISGQPAPKPGDLQAPGSNAPVQQDPFEAGPPAMPQAPQAKGGVDPFEAGPQQAASAEQPSATSAIMQSVMNAMPSASGLAHGAVDALPAIGMGAGAAAGFVGMAGPWGIPVGGAAGAVAGESAKTFLNSVIFGKQPQSRPEFYGNLADAGKKGAEQAMGGEALMGAPAAESFAASGLKVATRETADTVGGLIKPAVSVLKQGVLEATERLTGAPTDVVDHYFAAPQPVKELAVASKGDVPTAANMQRQGMNSVVQQTRDTMEAPAKQLIANRVTSATPVEAGDQVKAAIAKNLNMQNDDFKAGYAATDAVNAALPLDINARLKFGKSILNDTAKSDLAHIPAYGKVSQELSGLFGAAETGAGFDNSIGELNSKITAAYGSGDTQMADYLVGIRKKANAFLEDQTTALARSVQNKTATEEQLAGFKKMADSQGIPNWKKYADDITEGHLAFTQKLNADYGPFKQLQSDIGGQTRSSGNGAVSLIKDINSTPSAKLMDTLLDPKNSEALAKMTERTPEIAQVSSRLSRNKS